MNIPTRVFGIAVFASLFVACAGQLEYARTPDSQTARPTTLVCKPAVAGEASNGNHFLRARRIGTSRSATNGEALSCLAEHRPSN